LEEDGPTKSCPLVLVIDDSEDAREMYTTVLRLHDFAVEEAIDGEQGLEKARRSLLDAIIKRS
jgi:DNA-binding response OmpR family regulator